MTRILLLVLLSVITARIAYAHEIRPGYLDIRERAEGEYSIVWKVPAAGDRRLGIYMRLPESCTSKGEANRTIESNYYFERSVVACQGGLKDQSIVIDGLRATMTDVISRIQHADGSVEVGRVTPQSPELKVQGQQTVWQVAWTYFRLGVEHILSGYDHLLFVFALLLLIADRWTLVKTITAFTAAHTITLGGATLGYFSLPQKPVEAAIALSIAFVASELIKMRPGHLRTAEAYPWFVAFAFGLLHGFGFAGALKEVGLPQSDVPTALLTFNLGVEAGQLLFVAAVLVLFSVARATVNLPITLLRHASGYVIGVMACFWLVERVSAF